jgi:predicted transposase/invertase (TIGR01784 family)
MFIFSLNGMGVMQSLIRFDWAIKKLLRSNINYGILEGFLSELLNFDIKIVKILESERNKEDQDDKYNRVDILVEDDKGELILIEVQVDLEIDYLTRLFNEKSKVFTEYMNESDPYLKVKKVYSVNVVYFDLGQGEDYVYHGTTNFIGIYKNDELKLNESQRRVYQKQHIKEIYPEYYVIKVNQFDDLAKNTLDEWIYFLKHEEIKDDFKAKGLKEAKEKLDSMKLSPDEIKGYKRYVENFHYKASMVDSSYGEGVRDGIEQGIDKGEKKKAISMAKEMLADGEPLEKIIKYSKLPESEVLKLKEELGK